MSPSVMVKTGPTSAQHERPCSRSDETRASCAVFARLAPVETGLEAVPAVAADDLAVDKPRFRFALEWRWVCVKASLPWRPFTLFARGAGITAAIAVLIAGGTLGLRQRTRTRHP
jgi:hypothetical protein